MATHVPHVGRAPVLVRLHSRTAAAAVPLSGCRRGFRDRSQLSDEHEDVYRVLLDEQCTGEGIQPLGAAMRVEFGCLKADAQSTSGLQSPSDDDSIRKASDVA